MIIQLDLIEKKKEKKKQTNTLAANPLTFGRGFGREGVWGVCINKWCYMGLHLKKKVSRSYILNVPVSFSPILLHFNKQNPIGIVQH